MSAPLSVGARSPSRRPTGRSRLATAALILLVLLHAVGGWLVWDNRRLVVTDYEVTMADLPADSSGIRIAQVSDLHAAHFGSFEDRLLQAVTAAQPDLVVITGDIVDRSTRDLTAPLRTAERLAQVAPTVFITGNHEADLGQLPQLLEGLEQRGVLVLRDEAHSMTLSGTDLVVVGLDDAKHRRNAKLPARSPGEVMDSLGITDDAPVLVLAHRPTLLPELAEHGADVVLSGHAHGGQVRIPGVGGLIAPDQGLFPALTSGVHRHGDASMVISRGLGNTALAQVRVNNPRELVIVDLVPAAD